MTNRIPVLIVGAGPTGLILACELARRNIAFRIIDKNLQPTLTSNATWIQTRTIEILDEMGILNRFLNKGHKCTSINIYSYGELLSKIDLNSINSEFKFVLQMPQSVTEQILNEYLNELNYTVERSRELITINPKDNSVHALIGHPDGQIENIECDWLVACDGAHSTVRKKTKVLFTGTDITQQFMVADVEMDSAFFPNEINVFFDAGTVLAAFPIRGYQFRINANLHTPGERYSFNAIELRKMVQQRSHNKAIVKEVSFISPYLIHNRLVKNMRYGRIFFAGDAAHLHSPAGGQGMNLGIQDAYNLAWKLELVICGKAKPSFLDSYHLERYPIAKKTVNRTKIITSASIIENFLLIDIRNLGMKILNKQVFSSTKFGDRITQLDFEYQKSPIIDYNETINANSPRQGQHAPDVIIDQSNRLYDYLHNNCFNILLFTAYLIGEKDLEEIIKLQQWLNFNYPNVKTHIITHSKSRESFTDNVIANDSGSIYKKYFIEEPTIYIIRPDKYIGYCSTGFKKENIEQFLQKNLI